MADASTFVFADLAGFTALTESHGDDAAAELACRFADGVRSLLPPEGRLLKTIGDAVMLRFDAPGPAVRAALDIVGDRFAAHGFPAVRVGLHHGRFVERSGDWFGATVNTAARVTALATAGEALATDAVRRASGRIDGVRFAGGGIHRIRGLAAPLRVWRLEREDARAGAGLPIDPVCRMAVDPRRAAGNVRHGVHAHVFCSLDCIAAFAANPDLYVEPDADQR